MKERTKPAPTGPLRQHEHGRGRTSEARNTSGRVTADNYGIVLSPCSPGGKQPHEYKFVAPPGQTFLSICYKPHSRRMLDLSARRDSDGSQVAVKSPPGRVRPSECGYNPPAGG